MKRILLSLAVASTFVSGRALAGADISVSIGWAAPPPMVVVSPGVEVVEDYDEEVFLSGGWYWVERDGIWYRTSDFRGHWVVVERPLVPVFIASHERGHYRHWKREERREERREDRKEDRKEVRKEVKKEKREKKHGKH